MQLTTALLCFLKRFLKTLQCIHDEGTVVVKTYLKRDQNQTLKDQEEKLAGKKLPFPLLLYLYCYFVIPYLKECWMGFYYRE